MADERSISLPREQAEQLARQAASMGLSVPAYLHLLERAKSHRNDPRFLRAIRFVFTKYPETLKRLSQ